MYTGAMGRFMSPIIVAMLIGLATGHPIIKSKPPYRCLAGKSCFPSRNEIFQFQRKLDGDILLPTNATYATTVASINFRSTRSPAIVVLVKSVSDIQEAMLFARQHTLLLSVKSGGWDVQARQSYDSSLQIDLSLLKGITTVATSGQNPAGEVTTMAGNTWLEVQREVNKITSLENGRNTSRVVVSPSDNGESIVDSVQSGGISLLSRSLGLVIDNLLEVKLVTTKGKLIKVNMDGVYTQQKDDTWHFDHDSDLFWALHGGGGGFGIPVSCTFKLHFAPDNMMMRTSDYWMYQNGQSVGKDGMKFMLKQISALPNEWGGIFHIGTKDQQGGLISSRLFHFGPLNSPTGFAANVVQSTNVSGAQSATLERTYVTFLDYATTLPPVNPINTFAINSLIPKEVITNDKKLDKFVNLIFSLLDVDTVQSDSYVACDGHLLGGTISTVPVFASPITPLRTAFLSMSCYLGIPVRDSANEETYIDRFKNFREGLAELGKGVYFNDALLDSVDWKRLAWGNNYARLVDAKRKWDSSNFLWCPNCVGSDFRFDCMYSEYHRGLTLKDYFASRFNSMPDPPMVYKWF